MTAAKPRRETEREYISPRDRPEATPLDRYLAAMRVGDLPFRPRTRRHLRHGAVMACNLPSTETVVYDLVVYDPKRTIRRLAEQHFISEKVVRRAMAHLVQHGWLLSQEPPWVTEFGADCDCPKPERRPPSRAQAARPVMLTDNNGRTALYRLYDGASVLLYIGISDDLAARMKTHAREQPWWPEVRRKTVAWYDYRSSADEAETLAIAAEKPLHNKAKVYAPKPTIEFELGQVAPPTCIGCGKKPRRGCRTCWDCSALEISDGRMTA